MSEQTKLVRAVERALSWLALQSWRHPLWTLALALALTVGSLLLARGLRVDTDLTALLPSSFSSVQNLETLKERMGGGGYVVVLARGDSPEGLRRFAQDATPRLAALPQIRYVDDKTPGDFFRDRALLYMEASDLELVHQRLARRVRWERQRNNPLFVDLEDKPPPPLDFSDIEARYRDKLGGRSLHTDGGDASDYHTNPEGTVLALLLKPASLSSDLGYARQLTADVQATLDQMDLSRYGPGFQVDLTGRYKKKIDLQARIEADLQVATLAALALMLLYLALHFRRLAAVALVVAPLLAGLLWTFGQAELLFDRLNILTAFLGSILLGLGMDHGIHLLSRYQAERARLPPEEAIAATFQDTGRAVVMAALTTLVAFAGVATSEFGAFREFGALAALGMAWVVLAYTALLPSSLRLLERLGWRPPAPRRADASPYARWLPRLAPALFWGFLVLLAGSAPGIKDASFNYDFAALEDSRLPSFQMDKEVNALLGRSQTPLVIPTESPAQERQVLAALRQRQEQAGAHSAIDFAASLDDLVPTDQARRKEIMGQIEDTLSKVRERWLKPQDQERFGRLRAMAQAEPFGRAQLPAALRRNFQGPRAQGDQGVVLVFPAVSLSDGPSILRLSQETRDLALPGGQTLSAAGEAMVLADILRMISREGPTILLVVLVLVLLTLWLLMGELRQALLALLPAVMTLVMTVGLLAAVGLQLNYLNIIMIPVLMGIAVDGGVHLTTRQRAQALDLEALAETAQAISGAVLTTALGFGAMILAEHPGLSSLGELALLGLGINLLACLLGLAGLLVLLRLPWRRRGWAAWVVTVGGAGEMRGGGTVGALVALPLAWALSWWPLWARLLVALALLALFLDAGRRYMGQDKQRDPQEIVADELIGCLLATLWLPWGLGWALLGFGLFRLLDIWKPGPIGWADRKLHGALGVMMDDVLAGLGAGALTAALWWALAP